MAALQEDKLKKPMQKYYDFFTDILAHTLHYTEDAALFNEFCQKRTILSIKMHIQQSGQRTTKHNLIDNYTIMDKRFINALNFN